MRKTRSLRPMAKRQRSRSPDGAPQTKKRYEEPPAEPVHGHRPLLKAELNWRTRNHTSRCHGIFLLDTGCTGAILNEEFVKKEKIPVHRRDSPIEMHDAQGDLMMGAGEYFTAPLEMVMGKHEESLRWEVGPLEKGISGYLPISWVRKHNPDINWHTNRIQFRSEHCKKHCIPTAVEVECIEDWEMLSEDRDEVYQVGTMVWHDEEGGDVSMRLLPEYQPWADVFSTEKSDQLPEHGSHDHHINLHPGTKPPFGPLYPCSDSELKVLKEFLNKAMANGKITRSNSSAAAPILFVPKASGKLRICVDYRGLNKITIKDKYPLPLMTELRDRLRTAKVFTKLDLKDGFNLLRIAHGDEWKTAFRTRYGLYQYNVMPFGLCNAPSSFQAMINEVLHDLLDQGVIAYIDDILIYSENMRQHVDLVQQVLQRLRDAGLHASIDKSFFHMKEVEYLGYQISEQGISMSKSKVNAVQEWPVPRNVKDVQAFLGFANFYRRFIEGFSKVCKPLTDLLRKEGKWFWTAACEQAFHQLKELFTSEPVLSHFHPTRRTVVETDASDFAKGAVLSQYGEDGKLHPVAFYSKKHSPAEVNYDIHDKEMGAIVAAFREWEHLLKSVEGEVTVFTDHKNLEYFNTTKVLTRRQARWSEDLAGYNFKVIYRPGVKNCKPDILSRRWDHRLGEGGELEAPQPQMFFRPGQLVLNPARVAALRVHTLQSTFLQKLKDAGDKDEQWSGILKALEEKKTGIDPALS